MAEPACFKIFTVPFVTLGSNAVRKSENIPVRVSVAYSREAPDFK